MTGSPCCAWETFHLGRHSRCLLARLYQDYFKWCKWQEDRGEEEPNKCLVSVFLSAPNALQLQRLGDRMSLQIDPKWCHSQALLHLLCQVAAHSWPGCRWPPAVVLSILCVPPGNLTRQEAVGISHSLAEVSTRPRHHLSPIWACRDLFQCLGLVSGLLQYHGFMPDLCICSHFDLCVFSVSWSLEEAL